MSLLLLFVNYLIKSFKSVGGILKAIGGVLGHQTVKEVAEWIDHLGFVEFGKRVI